MRLSPRARLIRRDLKEYVTGKGDSARGWNLQRRHEDTPTLKYTYTTGWTTAAVIDGITARFHIDSPGAELVRIRAKQRTTSGTQTTDIIITMDGTQEFDFSIAIGETDSGWITLNSTAQSRRWFDEDTVFGVNIDMGTSADPPVNVIFEYEETP